MNANAMSTGAHRLLRTLLAPVALCSILVGLSGSGTSPASAPLDASVLEHHKRPTRDGHYVDPALSRVAAAGLRRDPTFQAPLDGPILAQPLFWDGSTE